MTTDQTSPARRPRVAIIFGGRSSEHAVSSATAAGVLRAIDRDRYDVVPIGIARTGEWVLVEDEPAHLELTAARTPEEPMSVTSAPGCSRPPRVWTSTT
jgi:D-alanine-D-alanine ligase